MKPGGLTDRIAFLRKLEIDCFIWRPSINTRAVPSTILKKLSALPKESQLAKLFGNSAASSGRSP